MTVEVSRKDISNSLRRFQDYILENYMTISAKHVRAKMEEDLQVPQGTLKPDRKHIEKLILTLIEKHQQSLQDGSNEGDQQEQNAAAANQQDDGGTKGKQKSSQPKVKVPRAKVNSEASKPRGKAEKAPQQSKAGQTKPSKHAKRSIQPDKPAEGKKGYSRAVKKMQAMCKQATITIPPQVWSKARQGEDELQQAFIDLLAKHDLSPSSGSQDVERAKHALATQRDLDGIDTSNIVSQSRRAAAPRVNYALAAGKAGSSDDSELEDEDDASSSSDAESAGSEPADDASDGPSNKRSRADGGSKPARPQESGSNAAEASDEDSAEDQSNGQARQSRADKTKGSQKTSDEDAAPKRRRGTAALGSDDDDDGDFGPRPKKAAAASTARQAPEGSSDSPAAVPAVASEGEVPSSHDNIDADDHTQGAAGAATKADAGTAHGENGKETLAGTDSGNSAQKAEAAQPMPDVADIDKSKELGDSSPPVKGRRTFTLDSDDE